MNNELNWRHKDIQLTPNSEPCRTKQKIVFSFSSVFDQNRPPNLMQNLIHFQLQPSWRCCLIFVFPSFLDPFLDSWYHLWLQSTSCQSRLICEASKCRRCWWGLGGGREWINNRLHNSPELPQLTIHHNSLESRRQSLLELATKHVLIRTYSVVPCRLLQHQRFHPHWNLIIHC